MSEVIEKSLREAYRSGYADGCKDCPLVNDICTFLKRELNGNVERGGKPYNCPLVEIPDAPVVITAERSEE